MKDKIQILLQNYLLDNNLLIDSKKDYYQAFVKELPEYLKNYFNDEKYLIKASCGNGQKCEIPWLCIFNKQVTTSATRGIYICYLFKKDMSGFYLVLGQGITTFEKLFGKNKYTNIKKVAEYFRTLINDDKFSDDNISLNGTTPLSKGYEAGTIIYKYYNANNYEENELLKDLNDMKKIYDDICYNLIDTPYMDIVNNVILNMDPSYVVANLANKMIEEALLKETGKEAIEVVTLETVDIPKLKKKNKYSGMTKKMIRKTDYLKKTIKNADNGLIGESLVIEYEKEKLLSHNRADLIEKIKWISKEEDGTGYDIISYDIDENGNEHEIYIEVKATEGNGENIFFISANEINVMEKLKEKYFVYRVSNVKSKNPKVFILDYNNFKERIELSIANYQASIVGE